MEVVNAEREDIFWAVLDQLGQQRQELWVHHFMEIPPNLRLIAFLIHKTSISHVSHVSHMSYITSPMPLQSLHVAEKSPPEVLMSQAPTVLLPLIMHPTQVPFIRPPLPHLTVDACQCRIRLHPFIQQTEQLLIYRGDRRQFIQLLEVVAYCPLQLSERKVIISVVHECVPLHMVQPKSSQISSKRREAPTLQSIAGLGSLKSGDDKLVIVGMPVELSLNEVAICADDGAEDVAVDRRAHEREGGNMPHNIYRQGTLRQDMGKSGQLPQRGRLIAQQVQIHVITGQCVQCDHCERGVAQQVMHRNQFLQVVGLVIREVLIVARSGDKDPQRPHSLLDELPRSPDAFLRLLPLIMGREVSSDNDHLRREALFNEGKRGVEECEGSVAFSISKVTSTQLGQA